MSDILNSSVQSVVHINAELEHVLFRSKLSIGGISDLFNSVQSVHINAELNNVVVVVCGSKLSISGISDIFNSCLSCCSPQRRIGQRCCSNKLSISGISDIFNSCL